MNLYNRQQRAFLTASLFLAVGIGSMVAEGRSECCPTCSATSVTPLNQSQVQQVMDNRDFILNLRQNPHLLYNDSYQRPIVKLTRQQELQILRNYPDLLVSRETFEQAGELDCTPSSFVGIRCSVCPPGCVPNVQRNSPTSSTCVPESTPAGRRRRRQTSPRICMAKQSTEPFILVNTPSGHVVQLAQTGDKNQWILKETCQKAMDQGFSCGLDDEGTDIPALFINLSNIILTGGSSSDFDMAYVTVRCCVAMSG
ncbi:uncharacterized protein LOC119719115 [Patiria miniata]|uniref:Uncharacterized protein n=1 Tax=Patiria miniata TaxID=46514 RepID=A0A913YYB6_PATMI|nr:uncharacterized protein LOC119719115 [Patiria miniata]